MLSSFTSLKRIYPNNAVLSKYALESTNNSIRKLTQEYDEKRKIKLVEIIIEKYFDEKEKREIEVTNKLQDVYIFSFILSITTIILNFLFIHK